MKIEVSLTENTDSGESRQMWPVNFVLHKNL